MFNLGNTDLRDNGVLDLALQNNNSSAIIKMIFTSKSEDHMKELKKSLIKHIDDENYETILPKENLCSIKEIDLDDPELSSALVERCKRFTTGGDAESLIDLLSVDLKFFTEHVFVSHIIKAENIPAAQHCIKEYEGCIKNRKCQEAIAKVTNDEFIRSIVSTNIDDIVNFPEDCLSPELILAVLNTPHSRAGIRLIDRLSNSPELLKNFIDKASGEQLASCILKLGADSTFMKEISSHITDESTRQSLVDNVNKICDKIKNNIVSLAEKGDVENLIPLLRANVNLIYLEKGGKSLLEIASDNGRTELVKSLISLHNENIKQATRDLHENPGLKINVLYNSFNQLSKVNYEEVLKIIHDNKDIIDSGIERVILNNAMQCSNHKLVAYCNSDKSKVSPEYVRAKKEIDSSADRVDPLSGVVCSEKEIGASSSVDNVPLGSNTDDDDRDVSSEREVGASSSLDDVPLDSSTANRFGALSGYVDAIRGRDLERFKKEVTDKLSKNIKEYVTKSHGNEGHTIFSLVASLGSTEQWEKLESSYKSVPLKKKIKSLFPSDPLNGNRSSSIGSPLQCAIMWDNNAMVELFLNNIKSSELSAGYGENKNNVIHTAVLHGKINLLRKIINDNRFPKAEVVKAFLQPNKDGITPFTMAFNEGYGKLCREFIKAVKESGNIDQCQNILLDENLLKAVIDFGDVSLFQDMMDIQRHANKSKKAGMTIHLLNHRISNGNLLSYACKNAEPTLLEVLIKCCEVQELFGALEDVIRERSNIKPEVLEKLVSHLVRYSSEEHVANQIVPLAVKYDNPIPLMYLVNAIDVNDPRFNVRDLIIQK